MITITGWQVKETEKAVLFIPVGQMDLRVWLPKSQISVRQNEWDDTLVLPRWLAKNNGIREEIANRL